MNNIESAKGFYNQAQIFDDTQEVQGNMLSLARMHIKKILCRQVFIKRKQSIFARNFYRCT